ncbi:MAG: PAS domain S-box protein [Chloroflexi bacterium]|nr:PAS domain S-box protein [Chloroflexota bacterium]
MDRKLHILLLEDNPDDAELLLHELRRVGFDFECIQVQTKAGYLEQLSERMDIILADYTLPQFDALTALKLLQERNLDIPFLVVTGTVSEEAAAASMRQGAADYLLKDRLTRLGSAVRRALDDRKLREANRLAEEALRQSEERYRMISELTSDFTYALILNGQGSLEVEWITEAVERITGYSRAETLALGGWDALVHEQDRTIVREHRRILLEGRSHVCELRIVTKNGQVRWLRDYAKPESLGEGEHQRRFFGAAQDITLHRQAESHMRYQANLLRNVSDAIISTDLNMRILSWNQAAEEIYGWESSEVLGMALDDVVRTQYFNTPNVPTAEYLQAHSSWKGEIIQLHKDGFAIPVLSSLSVVRDDDGRAIGIVGVNHDISERIRTESEMRRLNANLEKRNNELITLHEVGKRLSATLDATQVFRVLYQDVAVAVLGAEAILVLNYDLFHRVVRCNYAIVQDVEIDATIYAPIPVDDDPIGRCITSRHPQQLKGEDKAQLQEIEIFRTINQLQEMESVLLVPMTSSALVSGVIILIHSKPYMFDQVNLALLTTMANQTAITLENARLFDQVQMVITELEKRVESRTAELEAANAALLALDRQKTDFISTSAHELRTPLTTIQGFSEILLERQLNEDRSRRYLRMINEQATQLNKLVDDLLDVSRIEMGRGVTITASPLRLIDLVDSIVPTFAESSPHHKFQVIHLAELPMVQADAFRLGQVIRNLISNAVKYSPDGGCITIDGKVYSDNQVLIRISDEGVGISEGDLRHLGEKFYRAHASNTAIEGTGLGLYITKAIVESHAGEIWFESRVGCGTTVHVTLPIWKGTS